MRFEGAVVGQSGRGVWRQNSSDPACVGCGARLVLGADFFWVVTNKVYAVSIF